MRTKLTYEELEAKCQLQQNKLDAINKLMGVIEGASDLAKSGIEKLEQQLAAVVAENAGLKESLTYTGLTPKYGKNLMMDMKRPFIDNLLQGAEYYSVCGHISAATNRAIAAVHGDYSWMPETPSTDAYLAEVRAHARNEGINYAASRLAAAFNHGFVDKPLAEVYDVVRMILTAKEDLANDPAADGLSGEYAEKSLVEFAAQLRQGAAL